MKQKITAFVAAFFLSAFLSISLDADNSSSSSAPATANASSEGQTTGLSGESAVQKTPASVSCASDPDDSNPPVEHQYSDAVGGRSQEDTVYTQMELYDWILEHAQTGGTVLLGDTIFWGAEISNITVTGSITIDTNGYGITVLGDASMQLSGPITIAGNGPTPLVTIKSTGLLTTNDWVCIQASGKESVAVLVEEDAHFSPYRSLISAKGERAVAIRAKGELDLSFAQIRIAGEDSVGIDCAGDLSLIYTMLHAQEGEAIRAEGDILLDSCDVSPVPAHAVERERTAELLLPSPFWCYAPAGQEPHLLDNLTLLLTGPGLQPEQVHLYDVCWDLSKVDLDTVGTYTMVADITANAPFYYDGIPERINVPLHVFDSSVPYITAVKDYSHSLGIRFYQTFDQPVDRLIVWESPDEGITWREYPAENILDFSDSTLDLAVSIDGDAVLCFYIELTCGSVSGRSNAFLVNRREGTVNNVGGDRDGGDRDEQTLPSLGGAWEGEQIASAPSDTNISLPSTETTDSQQPVDASDPRRPAFSGATPPAPSMPSSSGLPSESAFTVPETNGRPQIPVSSPRNTRPVGQSFTQQELLLLTQANPEAVTFISGELRVNIPSKALEGLSLPDGAPFTISLSSTRGGFFVGCYAGDQFLEDFPNMPFTLYLTTESELASCSDADGTCYPAEPADGGYKFVISRPGSYALQTLSSTSSEGAFQESQGDLSTRLLALLIAVIFILPPSAYLIVIMARRRSRRE